MSESNTPPDQPWNQDKANAAIGVAICLTVAVFVVSACIALGSTSQRNAEAREVREEAKISIAENGCDLAENGAITCSPSR